MTRLYAPLGNAISITTHTVIMDLQLLVAKLNELLIGGALCKCIHLVLELLPELHHFVRQVSLNTFGIYSKCISLQKLLVTESNGELYLII